MKKINLVLAGFLTVLLASCGSFKNENGWYTDFDEAKKAASSSNKNIYLLVSSYNDFEGAKEGIASLTQKPDFSEALKDDFVCVFFDFTNIQSDLNPVFDNVTGKEQKALEQKRQAVLKQTRYADLFAIPGETPFSLIASKEGYFISNVVFNNYSDNIQGYVSNIHLYDEEVKAFNTLVEHTKKGKKENRAQAVKTIYEQTNETNRALMRDLWKKGISFDKKDVLGMNSSYIFDIANIDAYNFIVEGNLDGAALCWQKCAEDTRVNNETRQNTYFLIVSMLSSDPEKYLDKMASYLQKGIDVDPESEISAKMKQVMTYVEESIEQKKELTSSAK